jgi:hypothetical protein
VEHQAHWPDVQAAFLGEKHATLKSSGIKDVDPILNRAAGLKFHNTGKLDFQKLKGDPGEGRPEPYALHQELLVERGDKWPESTSAHRTFLVT